MRFRDELNAAVQKVRDQGIVIDPEELSKAINQGYMRKYEMDANDCTDTVYVVTMIGALEGEQTWDREVAIGWAKYLREFWRAQFSRL